jgi:ABC-2 type transport system permease protein
VTERIRRFARNVWSVAWREAALLRHDTAFIGVIAVQPVMMILLFGYALSNEPANVPWALLDQSQSPASRRFAAEIEATGTFLAPRPVTSWDEGRALLARGRSVAFVVIPRDFHRDAWRGGAEVEVLLDGADPLSAARVGAYLGQLARGFDPSDRAQPPRRADRPAIEADAGPLASRPRFWFNPALRDRDFFLAALAGMLLTNLCFSASSLGIVGERESGTYEATLALPTTPVEIVLGKLLPLVAISYYVLAFAVVAAGLLLGVWPRGSWLALGLLTLPFVLASLSVGVLVSARVRTRAPAVLVTVFVILPSFVVWGVLLP